MRMAFAPSFEAQDSTIYKEVGMTASCASRARVCQGSGAPHMSYRLLSRRNHWRMQSRGFNRAEQFRERQQPIAARVAFESAGIVPSSHSLIRKLFRPAPRNKFMRLSIPFGNRLFNAV